MEPLEAILEDIVAGTADVSSIPLAQAVEATEALAESDATEVLLQHVERVLPRLVKKERFDEVEAIWITCCTAEALPRDAMVRAAERISARGQGERVVDLMTMLAEALVESGRAAEGLEVIRTGLAWSYSERFAIEARKALSTVFPESPNLEQALSKLDHATTSVTLVEEIAAATRALRFHPGTYLQLSDWSIAQVVATDGHDAQVRHPSGMTETRSVAGDPPPKVFECDAHEVRRLFHPEQLHDDWLRTPTEPLHKLLLEQQGVFSVSGFKEILVPRILTEVEFEDVLERLRQACSQDDPDLPSYESKRRLFIAPGVAAPRPKRRAPRRAPSEEASTPREKAPRRVAAPAQSSTPTIVTAARWIDLTTRPEIRRLISRIENEISELNHEMNVDLPKKLEEARAHGDLRENAEYDAAKERLRLVQSRIEQLHGRLAKIRELAQVRLIPGRITTMSTIIVADEETGAERRFRLVPPELPDPSPGDVSIGTPYAKALLGKTVGDLAVVKLPRRIERIEVVNVTDPEEG